MFLRYFSSKFFLVFIFSELNSWLIIMGKFDILSRRSGLRSIIGLEKFFRVFVEFSSIVFGFIL